MSLNIVDALVDKLFFTTLRGNENPLTRKFAGSQNLLGNSRMYESIQTEFHTSFFGNECVSPSYCIENQSLKEKMFPFIPLESPSHNLVNRVPKIIIPSSTFNQDLFTHCSSKVERSLQQEFLFNQGLTVLQEAIEQQSSVFKTLFSVSEALEKEMTADIVISSAVVQGTPKAGACMKQDEHVAAPAATPGGGTGNFHKPGTFIEQKKQKIQADSASLNRELTNRKTREIQKRSKKRRRRQKKSQESKKCTDSVNNSLNVEPQNKKTAEPPLVHLNCDIDLKSTKKDNTCDIFRDIVGVGDTASNLQILMPENTFVISLDSTCDDDSDWDNNSEIEFFTDSTEFEFSGLFVANLAPTSGFSFTSCTSHITVSPAFEDDPEMHKLKTHLKKVNKDWSIANEEFSSNAKVATKVSFAAADVLLEVFEVEGYDRKGEWETYACERLRFKRRIDEMESILSPCLSKEHREKVYLQLYKTNL